MQDVKLALIGAGGRGAGMAGLLLDSDRPVTFAALAEPLEARRVQVGERLNVRPEQRFADHSELLAQCRDLDGAIIATDVSTHAAVACACLEAGVPIYLEKPMTRSIAEAQEVVKTAQRTGVPVMIGFNLRYAPFYHRLQQLVSEGVVGDVVSIEWKEVLSPAAWAVGYCRSSWYSRQDEAGGWLLEKSCHDIDQINWLAASPCLRVASFGSRSHFNARADVPQRCTDGCPIEAECPYSCFKVSPGGQDSVPGYVPKERWDLCVYHCGADLMDRQVAIMEYENGTTAAFTIVPSGPRWERLMRICGTKATIRAGDHTGEIRIYQHGEAEPLIEDVSNITGDHGGADPRIIAAFVDFIADPAKPPRATLADGLESMLVAGGIEHARDQNTVIELEQWRHGRA